MSKPVGDTRERRWFAALPVTLWTFGAFLGVTLAVGALAYAVLRALAGSDVRLDPNVQNVGIAAIAYAAALLVILGVPRLLRLWSGSPRYRELIGLTRTMSWKDIGYAVIGIVVYLAGSTAFIMLIQHIFPAFDAAQKQSTGFTSMLTPANASLVFFALVVIAPVAEEIIFRGYLFGTLRRAVPISVAALIVSLVFAALHLPGESLQWNVAADVFVLSLVSCYLRARTGAIWSSMLLHMAKNCLAFYLLYVASCSIM